MIPLRDLSQDASRGRKLPSTTKLTAVAKDRDHHGAGLEAGIEQLAGAITTYRNPNFPSAEALLKFCAVCFLHSVEK